MISSDKPKQFEKMKNKTITILIFLLTNINLLFPDTIDYWKIRKEDIIRISANENSFDSTEFIYIYNNDLKRKFEISYCRDIDYKTEKKLLFKRKETLINELNYKISGIFDPMKFTLEDVVCTDLFKNDTIKIYYTETGGEYSNKNLKYIGSFIVKEHIKKNELTKDNHKNRKYNYLFLLLFLPFIAVIIKSRNKKKIK